MKVFSIGFYNTENFFDCRDNAVIHDADYTPQGSKKWTNNRYADKVNKIGQAISRLGWEKTGMPPLFVGLAEIENANVLNDLIHSRFLEEFGYQYIHFDSLDERGMDTAMLYRKEFIFPVHVEPMRMVFPETGSPTDYTRDVLYIQFQFQFQSFLLHSFVVHLPSRRDFDVNQGFRNLILKKIRHLMDEILTQDPKAYIILMGDMNGNPDDSDAVGILRTRQTRGISPNELYNPMWELKKNTGSLTHDGNWILFDQMLFSQAFLQPGGLEFKNAEVFRERFLQDRNPGFQGRPFRTYAGNKYLGGYSDHFPVYAILNH